MWSVAPCRWAWNPTQVDPAAEAITGARGKEKK